MGQPLTNVSAGFFRKIVGGKNLFYYYIFVHCDFFGQPVNNPCSTYFVPINWILNSETPCSSHVGKTYVLVSQHSTCAEESKKLMHFKAQSATPSEDKKCNK